MSKDKGFVAIKLTDDPIEMDPIPPERSTDIVTVGRVTEVKTKADQPEIKLHNVQDDAIPANAECFCCYKQTGLTLISQVKPRIMRLLQLEHGGTKIKPDSYVCSYHLSRVLQNRVDQLLEEDKNQISKLQEEAMRNLEKYELDEQTWKDQFQFRGTIGERAADMVASIGGSWPFLGYLMAILAFWMITNLILTNIDGGSHASSAWDPYPFILLNLFLSMLAATQAPVIMMSQNRQAAIDRIQNDFVSKSILRNEHQTRHVDAKLDYLISYQWKRLLEIQDIQTNLMEVHFKNTKKKKGLIPINNNTPAPTDNKVIAAETIYDPLAHALLDKYVNPAQDFSFIFSHWHQDGDNFSGNIEHVELDKDDDGQIQQIRFKIKFGTTKATLDDIFSGEGNVTLRNDFNVPEMSPHGRFSFFQIPMNDQFISVTNGEFPPRYKPVFSRVREDRITEFWKTHFGQIYLAYIPPAQFATITVPPEKMLGMVLTLHPDTNAQQWDVYLYKHREDIEFDLLNSVVTRPLSSDWTKVVDYNYSDSDSKAEVSTLNRRSQMRRASSVINSTGQDILIRHPVNVSIGTLEPGTYTFLCDNGRVGYHGTFE
ncbi:hypothetical protein HDV04_001741 [Boothiomyces sp. JEL0838]|nr:hypothetical protein HDV04_001741 [Boothiomyces sp. JEL0838]